MAATLHWLLAITHKTPLVLLLPHYHCYPVHADLMQQFHKMFQSHSFTSLKALHAGWWSQPARVKLANTNTATNTIGNPKTHWYLTTFHGARVHMLQGGAARQNWAAEVWASSSSAGPCRPDPRPSHSPAKSSGHWRVREIQSAESKNTVGTMREIRLTLSRAWILPNVFLSFVFLMAEKKLSSQRHNIALA